jgi:DNA processing protein
MLEKFPIKKLETLPDSLKEIPGAPKQLYFRGSLPTPDTVYLAVVGARKYSQYGKEACQKIIQGLKGYPVTIVSGLALGIDAIAHEEALRVGLKTIAIPGSGLGEEVLYPRSNLGLAKRILEHGGCLLSELEEQTQAAEWTFPQRNRIMAGISKAVLVIEAEKKSGTLITSRLATEYGRDVLAVPGSIFSSLSEGPHLLLSLGAGIIQNSSDLLQALGIEEKGVIEEKTYTDLSTEERSLVELLKTPQTRDDLADTLGWNTSTLSETITLLELKGVIKENLGKIFLA